MTLLPCSGGNALVTHIQRNTRIPVCCPALRVLHVLCCPRCVLRQPFALQVLGHADGVCHMYIDAAADLSMACSLAVDSKVGSLAVGSC